VPNSNDQVIIINNNARYDYVPHHVHVRMHMINHLEMAKSLVPLFEFFPGFIEII